MASKKRKQNGSDANGTVTPPKKQKSEQGGGWQSALLKSMNDPSLRVFDDDSVVVIKDKYPKARHHFLVLAKEDISDLNKLTDLHVKLLDHMKNIGVHVASKHGLLEDFRLGFHTRPSLTRLHLHVISQDFDSNSLKTKKHWNSFTTAFFRDIDDVMNDLRENGKVKLEDGATCDAMLNENLRCHRCREEFSNIPKLKSHIKKHFPEKT